MDGATWALASGCFTFVLFMASFNVQLMVGYRDTCGNRAVLGHAVLRAVNRKLTMERFYLFRRFQCFFFWVVAVMCLQHMLLSWWEFETRWRLSWFKAIFGACFYPVLHALLLLLATVRGGFTRTRLLAWVSMFGFGLLVMHFLGMVASYDLLAFFGILAVVFDPIPLIGIVTPIAIIHIVQNEEYWTVTAILAMFLLVLICIIVCTWISVLLSSAIDAEVKLSSSEDAGEALFALLCARYDAVLELDDASHIVHASETFFGIASVEPPLDTRRVSRKFLRIGPKAPVPHNMAKHSLMDTTLAEMLTNDADRRRLMSVIQEQTAMLEVRQIAALERGDGDFLERHATALHVYMRTHAQAEVKLNLYCTSCVDSATRRPRFFVGVCVSQSPHDAPQCPEARLGVVPAASRDCLTIEKTSATLALTETAMLKGRVLQAGTPLVAFFRPHVMSRFESFLQRMLSDAQPYEERFFETLSSTGPGGLKATDDISLQILRDNRASETPTVLMQMTVTSRPKCAPRSARSSRSGSVRAVRSQANLERVTEENAADAQCDGTQDNQAGHWEDSVGDTDDDSENMFQMVADYLVSHGATAPTNNGRGVPSPLSVSISL